MENLKNLNFRLLITYLIFLAILSKGQIIAQETQVTVDFGSPIVYRYMDSDSSKAPLIGFLHGYPKVDSLWSKYVKPLEPNFWRAKDFYEDTVKRLFKLNPDLHFQVVAAGNYGIYKKPLSHEKWPYNDWSQWEAHMKQLVEKVPKHLLENNFSIDVWNEPDAEHFWKGTEEQFFEVFCKSISYLNSIEPRLKVAGPSTRGKSREYMLRLFEYMAKWKRDNPDKPLRMDYLALHSMSGYDIFLEDIDFWAKAIYKENRFSHLGINGIIYNEYLRKGEQSEQFAWAIQLLSLFENLEIKYAARACWGTCFDGSLDGILNVNQTGVSANQNWYGYQQYARINGKRFKVEKNGNVGCIAGENINGDKVILIGNLENAVQTMNLKLSTINVVEINVLRITNNGIIKLNNDMMDQSNTQLDLKMEPLSSYVIEIK